MKKLISFGLAVALLLSLAGCGGASAPEETTVPETTAAETVPETTEAKVEGYLFLTVSEITFSTVGMSEDVYIGSIPRELVVWESADSAVATVENGVLTAVGVGTTTVTGTYDDQSVQCTVSCLAENEEALAELDSGVLRSPMRMPFRVESWPTGFYDDAAFVGDSITYTLWHTAGKNPDELLKSIWLVRGGTSINGFVRNYKNIYYKGREMKLDDAIAAAGVNKVFLMLGQNDLSYMSIEDTMANWDKLLERILAQSPNVEIYIQSLVPEWMEDFKDNAKNDKIDEYNDLLKVYCEEHGYYYVEIAAYVEDHTNRMATVYSMDKGIHINYDGTAVWMEALKAYAQLHELRGE